MSRSTAAMHTLAAVIVFGATACDSCKPTRPAGSTGSASAVAGSTSSAHSVATGDATSPDAASTTATSTSDARVFAPTPVTVDEATAILPSIDGTLLVPPRAIAGGQVHASWCVSATTADAAAQTLANQLTASGWLDVATRGDATKAGVSAHRSRYTLSIIVSSSTALTCRAPTHYLAAASLFETPR